MRVAPGLMVACVVVVSKWTTGFPFPLEDERMEEGSGGTASLDRIQLCGHRIMAQIGTICHGLKVTYRPNSRRPRDSLPTRPTRSVVHHCCIVGCTFTELDRYCGYPEFVRIQMTVTGTENGNLEDGGSVKLEDFIQDVAELLEFSGDIPYQTKPIVRIRGEMKKILVDDSQSEEHDPVYFEGTKRHVKSKHFINSDESPQDTENYYDVPFVPVRSDHIIKTEYKLPPPLVAGMEKLIGNNGGGELAVILPNRHG